MGCSVVQLAKPRRWKHNAYAALLCNCAYVVCAPAGAPPDAEAVSGVEESVKKHYKLIGLDGRAASNGTPRTAPIIDFREPKDDVLAGFYPSRVILVMDLRKHLSGAAVETAASTLDYQPFILSDDIQTGVANSWLNSSDARIAPKIVFRRNEVTPEQWKAANEANGRLRAMYDDLLDEVVSRFPRGSLLDIACNNGYFPVGAERRGMKAAGLDCIDRTASFKVLNDALGTRARYLSAAYDPLTHSLPIEEKFDVTVMSAIMCHLPDPLNFLAAAAKISNKAILFWGQVVDTETLVVAYYKPHPNLPGPSEFPFSFNDNTRISLGMFKEAARELGFSNVVRIPAKPTWITQFDASSGPPLEAELAGSSSHMALLIVR